MRTQNLVFAHTTTPVEQVSTFHVSTVGDKVMIFCDECLQVGFTLRSAHNVALICDVRRRSRTLQLCNRNVSVRALGALQIMIIMKLAF